MNRTIALAIVALTMFAGIAKGDEGGGAKLILACNCSWPVSEPPTGITKTGMRAEKEAKSVMGFEEE